MGDNLWPNGLSRGARPFRQSVFSPIAPRPLPTGNTVAVGLLVRGALGDERGHTLVPENKTLVGICITRTRGRQRVRHRESASIRELQINVAVSRGKEGRGEGLSALANECHFGPGSI